MISQIAEQDGDEVAAVRALFLEYAASLGFDLGFQSFEQELIDLPGPYATPWGRLLLAKIHGQPAGCVALKKLSDPVCEMKRLYIRDSYRGAGLGRQLAERIIQEAQTIGYKAIRLDTIPSIMDPATALYRSLGFQLIPPYCLNPIPGALFMELKL